MWTANSYQMSHTKGARCWESTLTTVLSNWSAAPYVVGKPECLPPIQGVPSRRSPSHLGVRLHGRRQNEVAAITESDRAANIHFRRCCSRGTNPRARYLVILHPEGIIRRTFTKDYVQRLLGSYPPLLVDPQNVSVFKAGDEARGGWVVALGLVSNYDPEDVFLPVYYDCVRYHRDRIGGVFWRSMDHVRLILESIWAKAFRDDAVAYKEINCAINALQFMRKWQTVSGANCSNIPTPPNSLSVQHQNRIIADFNGPPRIADDEEQQWQFRAEWKPLLHYVLIAAVNGWVRCIVYFK